MDKRSGMAGVERLQQVKGLAAAHLAQENPIRPHPQRRLEQVANRDGRHARLLAPGFQAHEVALVDLKLGGVLDNDDALLGRNKGGQRIQQGRLAGAGATRDQEVLSVSTARRRTCQQLRRERADDGRAPRRCSACSGICGSPEPCPSTAHGGKTAATREPSGSRESRSGFSSLISSPSARAMLRTATWRDFSGIVTPELRSIWPTFSMKTPARAVDHDVGDLRVSNEALQSAAGTENALPSSWSDLASSKACSKYDRVLVQVIRLQIAIGGRQRIQAVVGQHNRLGVLEFRKHLGLKGRQHVRAVGLARAQGRPVRGRQAREHADARHPGRFRSSCSWA